MHNRQNRPDQNPKGIEARGIARLAADLGCIPADAEQVLRDVAECERVIGSTVPESRYPDIEPELAADVLAFETPAQCRKRFAALPPLSDLMGFSRRRAEQVEKRAKAMLATTTGGVA